MALAEGESWVIVAVADEDGLGEARPDTLDTVEAEGEPDARLDGDVEALDEADLLARADKVSLPLYVSDEGDVRLIAADRDAVATIVVESMEDADAVTERVALSTELVGCGDSEPRRVEVIRAVIEKDAVMEDGIDAVGEEEGDFKAVRLVCGVLLRDGDAEALRDTRGVREARLLALLDGDAETEWDSLGDALCVPDGDELALRGARREGAAVADFEIREEEDAVGVVVSVRVGRPLADALTDTLLLSDVRADDETEPEWVRETEEVGVTEPLCEGFPPV